MLVNKVNIPSIVNTRFAYSQAIGYNPSWKGANYGDNPGK